MIMPMDYAILLSQFARDILAYGTTVQRCKIVPGASLIVNYFLQHGTIE